MSSKFWGDNIANINTWIQPSSKSYLVWHISTFRVSKTLLSTSVSKEATEEYVPPKQGSKIRKRKTWDSKEQGWKKMKRSKGFLDWWQRQSMGWLKFSLWQSSYFYLKEYYNSQYRLSYATVINNPPPNLLIRLRLISLSLYMFFVD